MSQEKFDDLLRQSFEKERDIPFEESAWQSLAGRLPNNKKYFLPLWALLLLGSGWLLTALILLWPAGGTNAIAANTADSQHARTAQIAVPSPSFVTDTVYIPKVVEKTVVKYRYQTVTKPANSRLTNARPLAETEKITDHQLESIDPAITTNTPVRQIPESATSSRAYAELPARLIPPVPALENGRVTTLLANPGILPASEGTNAKSRFQIGLTAGWAKVNYNSFQTSLSSLDEAFSEAEDIAVNTSDSMQLVPLGIRQYGLQFSYRISRFFTLQAGIGRENISFQNERPFEGQFDASQRASESYNNTDLLLSQRGLYYELGIQGRMESRLSPIAQASLRMRSHLLRFSNLEGGQGAFNVPISNQYVSAESISSNSRRKSFHLEQLKLGAGMAYRISPDWEVQTTADFYAPLRYDGWLQPQWGLNLSLFYSL